MNLLQSLCVLFTCLGTVQCQTKVSPTKSEKVEVKQGIADKKIDSLDIGLIKSYDSKSYDFIRSSIEVDTIDNQHSYYDIWFKGVKFFFDDENKVLLYVDVSYPIIFFKKINYSNQVSEPTQFHYLDELAYVKNKRTITKKWKPNSSFSTNQYNIMYRNKKVIEEYKSHRWVYKEIDSSQLKTIHQAYSEDKVFIGNQDFYDAPIPKSEFKSKLKKIIHNTVIENLPDTISIFKLNLDLQLIIDKKGRIRQVLTCNIIYTPSIGSGVSNDQVRNSASQIKKQFMIEHIEKYAETVQEFLNDKESIYFLPAKSYNNRDIDGVYHVLINLGTINKSL